MLSESLKADAYEAEALEQARYLASHGVPIMICPPALSDSGEWLPDGGDNKTGYKIPPWSTAKADPGVVDGWRPGQGLAAIMGYSVDALDVDAQHQGDQTAATWEMLGCYPRSYGRQCSPSGGWHDLIAPLGVGSPTGIAPGVDVRGAKPDGSGRGLIFIGPTRKRSKTSGEIGTYRWEILPSFDGLSSADDSGRYVASLREHRNDSEEPADPSDHSAFDQLTPGEQERVKAYLSKALDGIRRQLVEATAWDEGERHQLHDGGESVGWQKLVANVAYRLGGLARAPWTPWTLREAKGMFFELLPDDMNGPINPEEEWANQSRRAKPAAFPLGQASDEFTPEPTRASVSSASSWAPVDLTPYLDGSYTPPKPSLMKRSDGQALLYAGCVHSLWGEPGCGKSMLAQWLSAVELADGNPVLYIDFESDPGQVLTRLRELGASSDAIRQHFTYLRPVGDPEASSEPLAALLGTLDAAPYSLAVVDGVNASMAALGVDGLAPNEAATSWHLKLPERIVSRTGAAVLEVDHVPKAKESRGRYAIGGQAKLANLTGAGFAIDVRQPLGRGKVGVLDLRLSKDRQGFLAGIAGHYRSDGTQPIARVEVDGTGDTITVRLDPPEMSENSDGEFRPTTLMERVSRFVEENPGATQKKITDAVNGKRAAVIQATKALVSEGWLTTSSGPRNATLHASAKPFRLTSDRDVQGDFLGGAE